MAPTVLVLGGNFAGLNAALHIKHELENEVDVTVISASDHFLFNPSLIWLPFGKRKPEDITFPLEPTFAEHGVEFVHAAASSIDAEAQVVVAGGTDYGYDYLVIATGYRNKMDVIPGLAEGNAVTITTLEDAIKAGERWQQFLDNPGDIVIGAAQGAGCFGAAYEFLFNTAHQLRKVGLRDRVKLTYVTSEPFLGNFGIGGIKNGSELLISFLRREGIDAQVDTGMESVDTDHLTLADGSELPFRYAMVVPPFVGQDVALDSGLADAGGYIEVRDTWQHQKYDNVYAAGIAAAVSVPWQTPTPTGMPKTGFPTEIMARVAAQNITHQIRGEKPTEQKDFADMAAVCVLDAGRNGIMMLGDKMLPPRRRSVMIPGPQNHAFKLAFEKYFLWKMRRGHVRLP